MSRQNCGVISVRTFPGETLITVQQKCQTLGGSFQKISDRYICHLTTQCDHNTAITEIILIAVLLAMAILVFSAIFCKRKAPVPVGIFETNEDHF